MQQGISVPLINEEITDKIVHLLDEFVTRDEDKIVEHIKQLAQSFSLQAQQSFYHHWKQLEYDLFFTYNEKTDVYAVDPCYGYPKQLLRFLLVKAAAETAKDFSINGDRMIANYLYKFGKEHYGLPLHEALPVHELEEALLEKGSVYASNDKKTPVYASSLAPLEADKSL